VEGRLDPAPEVGLGAARARQAVHDVRRHRDLACLRADDALVAAEPEPDLARDHRPVLGLDRVEVRRQGATRLEPAVHRQVLALGRERVAHA
jgi:hypothetical protein